jgi:hypothetical protein
VYRLEYKDISGGKDPVCVIVVLCDGHKQLLHGDGAWTLDAAEEGLANAIYKALREQTQMITLSRVPEKIRTHVDAILNHPDRIHHKAWIMAEQT